jgi:hypothetical protein
MPTTRQYTFDIDTKRYLNRVNTYRLLNGLPNITNGDAVDIDNFVIGLKDLGLWTDSYIWLLMSQHNVAAGVSLVGLNGNTPNGTLVNSPTWSTSGMEFLNSAAKRIVIPVTFTFGDIFTIFASAKLTNTTAPNLSILGVGNGRGGVIAVASNGSTLLRNASWDVNTFSPGAVTSNAIVSTNNFTSTITANSSSSSHYANTTKFSTLNGDYRISNAATIPTIGANYIAGGSYSGPFNGNIHIAFMLKRSITDSAQSSLYRLYKETVGKTLGLP